MSALQELIPFKVDVVPFEDLMLDEEWELIERGVIGAVRIEIIKRIASSHQFSERLKELEAKMVDHPFKMAMQEAYTTWRENFLGEWIVVGRMSLPPSSAYYLAAQPMKLTKLLPVDCCRFIGLL